MTTPFDADRIGERLADLLAASAPLESVLKSPPSVIRETAFHDFSRYLFLAAPHLGYALRTPAAVDAVRGERRVFGDDVEVEMGGDEPGRTFPVPATPGEITIAAATADFTDEITEFFNALPSRILIWRLGAWVVVPGEGPWTDTAIAASIVASGLGPGLVDGDDGLFALWRELGRPDWFWDYADVVVRRVLETEVNTLRATEAYREQISAAGEDPEDVLHEGVVTGLQSPDFWVGQRDELNNAMRAEADRQMEAAPPVETAEEAELPDYPFVPYDTGTVNFGLQVVYRQSWQPLGYQEGEILRTVPLGPKQTEKIAVKAIRRTKTTRQMETVTSIETATESSTATKDSQEVVNEASDSFRWNVEASASASFGFGSASLSAGMGGESASSSRDAKTTLNETMSKTTSRMRQETKIVVSTEVEETTDVSRESEIANPNDEIAVTYIYSRLQRQYEIYTQLGEVNACVFIAEHVPQPQQIDGRWIREHDTILARVLLDDSYRKDLELIRAQDPGPGEGAEGMDTAISGLMNGIVDTGLPRFESVAGSPPDLFSTPQASYERERERERSRRAERVAYDRSVRRLRRHLFDNILHYCRAIWSAEDPQQRLMRYAAITVPTEWSLVGSYSAGGVLKGVWRPELTPTTSLADLVNPAGPIGFAGNYAVFYLKQDGRYPDLDDAVGYLRLPYLLHRVEVLEAGADLSASVEISPNRLGSGDYEVVFRSPGAGTSYCEVSQILGDAADGRSIYVRFARVDLGATGGDVSFHGLRLSLTRPGGVLRDGDSVVISVSVDASLEDPEVRMIRFGLQPLDPSIEADYYTSEVLGEYEEFFPAVARALSARDAGAAWADLDDSTRRLVRGYRAEYELRKRHTRRFLLETNNVLLSRAVDPATSLETFKSLHRYIDVLASATDFEAKRIENARRERRLVLDRLGDPDVDRVTVVTGGVSPDFPAIDPTDDT